jgi:succinyl-diaminopimelate desuccinylase
MPVTRQNPNVAAERLAQRTLELVNIPSVSRDEAAIADYVHAAMPDRAFLVLYREDGCLCYLAPEQAGPTVFLAGHLDTVPVQGNVPGTRDAERVFGLGASDMKGGLAVMIELARWFAEERPRLPVRLGLLFFGGEELPITESPLPRFFDASGFRADLVIVLEPTDNEIHAGCLGNIEARLRFHGESAHSARPWTGTNAIELAVRGLGKLVGLERRPVEIDGLTFYEVLSVTGISGGIAANVIPAEAEAVLNFRYSPDRTSEQAEAALRELIDGVGELAIASNSPSGRVDLDVPLVRRLRRAGGFAVAPKQAWTPVAQFTERGHNAVNLGPGATRYAHRRDEQVEIGELARTYVALQTFLLDTVVA